MKKLVIAICLAANAAMASTDVYKFSATMKYPAIGKTSFVAASTSVEGKLTIDNDGSGTNTSAVLELTMKKPNLTYTLVAPDSNTVYAVFGKKDNECATALTFVNTDPTEGLVELTFYGWGNFKTKTTGGCTPCGNTLESCSRVTKLNGVIAGKYICPCGGKFPEWDGSCNIGTNETSYITVYGSSAKFSLKSVDGSKWK